MAQDAILLMGLVVSLYLYDSALLLHRNEGVLVAAGRREWLVDLGFHDFQLAGKNLFIPNPLFPHRSVFTLSWQFEGPFADAAQDWNAHRDATRPLAPLIWTMAVALFLLLPLGFVTRFGDAILVTAFVLLYLSIIVALTWTWRNRLRFGLSGAQFAGLAFESLVCSPMALNLTRKLCARIPSGEDLVSASRRLQNGDAWHATRSRLVARLDEAIELEEENSPRAAGLIEHRRRIMER